MTVIEKEYLPAQVVGVSFEASISDWSLVRLSTPWRRILRFFEEIENADSPMTLLEKVSLLEKPLNTEE